MMQSRLKVLFLSAWYPSEINPVAGIFIKEHAKAASLYNDIVVLYAYPDTTPKFWDLYQVIECIEDGIRTIRVRYGGVLAYLKGQIFKNKEVKKSHISTTSSNKLITTLRKPLKVLWILVGNLLYYWSIFAAFRKLVKEGWKPDIIHAHIYSIGVPAIILGRLYGIHVVITEQSSAFPRHLLGWLDRLKARFAMNRAKIILPVSNALKEAIETYGIRNDFQIVPNVVNTEIFYPLSSQNESKNKRKRILLVALLTPIKGVVYLLDALSQINGRRKDFTLDIVGDGANRGEYEDLARKLGLSDIVKFHGLKPKEEVAEFMRNCDFFVLPSLWDNMPCVLTEALASGKPVVASDIGGIKEIINENIGILAPPKDVDKLQRGIEFMLDNYTNYSQEAISNYAKRKYSHEAVGQLLDTIYREVKEIK